MSQCDRPGCTGTVDETGFCDLRGHQQSVRAAAPAASGTAVARPPPTLTAPATAATDPLGVDHTTTLRSTAREGRGTDGANRPDALPWLAQPPALASQLFTGVAVPEQHRECGNCGAPVGRSHDGQPALTEGFCPRCAAPYSFVPKLRAGDRVGDRYEIVGALGHGGLSWAYLAQDTHLGGRQVVVKGLIRPNDPDAAESVDRERRALVLLDHPGIVRIFDFVTELDPRTGDPVGYIVMEYAGGWTLQKLKMQAYAGERELPVQDVISYGIRILDAFEYLHERGFLYCDLKPENVIHQGDQVRLIDMGAVRAIDDRTSPTWGTRGFQVSRQEIRARGLTVRSDLYTVGRTLRALFAASPGGNPQLPAPPEIEAGIRSFRLVLDRACHQDWDQRFASAAQLREQLVGVLREITALAGKRPDPKPSTLFADRLDLLDDGLGAVPPLTTWTAAPASEAVLLATEATDGRPPVASVASGLPEPRPDGSDPAASFLAGVSTTDPRRLLDELATFCDPSVEIELWRCRAYLALARHTEAERALTAAADIAPAPHDWRITWHRGLLALAMSAVDPSRLPRADHLFTAVRGWLPGEPTPRLALGFTAEYTDRLADAADHYHSVWRTDGTAVSAAFGLARVHLASGDRDAAVAVLDEVPQRSRHYDRSRVAAIRLRAGHFRPAGPPRPADLADAVRRLAPENFAGADAARARARLVTFVRQAALVRLRSMPAAPGELPAGPVLGDPVTERGVRSLLSASFRELAARQAETETHHDVLVDLANTARPRTWC
ncbi:serine/threonine-protein kinase [Gandjariella thermophila]|uniref:non-specific serine/threonine protein kinase n=1 Tax=Gandjariella thermophila TaxID=1931992 RepID=A0A4D4JDC5_9PSEU|nr:serine/threonine-protein kinase [Gandjariella thermophila]GDY32658.1 serine/threonine protein kinase [Gandjariella thermophila]